MHVYLVCARVQEQEAGGVTGRVLPQPITNVTVSLHLVMPDSVM